jgi:hypothetical protein
MEELDYYTVMRKRIQYYRQKYDPLNRYAEQKKTFLPERKIERPKILREKVTAGYSYVVSLLF